MGISISWSSRKSHRVATSIYAGEIQALFYGFDTARFLKEMLSELFFGNVGCPINTYVRNDNSDAVYHMDSMDTVTNESARVAFWKVTGVTSEPMVRSRVYSWRIEHARWNDEEHDLR